MENENADPDWVGAFAALIVGDRVPLVEILRSGAPMPPAWCEELADLLEGSDPSCVQLVPTVDQKKRKALLRTLARAITFRGFRYSGMKAVKAMAATAEEHRRDVHLMYAAEKQAKALAARHPGVRAALRDLYSRLDRADEEGGTKD
jgi:hypothetical protein